MLSLRSFGVAFPRHLAEIVCFIKLSTSARKQRRRLLTLDKMALKDLGLSPHDALKEAARPFWDVPDNWRK